MKNDAINSAVETLTTLSTEPWTLRRIVSRMGLGSRNPAIVGSAEEVAEDLISWVDETDIDGFNLSRIVTPQGSRGFRRPGRAHPARARRLQARLSPRHIAREIVRRLAAAAAEPPGRRAPPAARQRSVKPSSCRKWAIG
jgi:hypothetical protein